MLLFLYFLHIKTLTRSGVWTPYRVSQPPDRVKVSIMQLQLKRPGSIDMCDWHILHMLHKLHMLHIVHIYRQSISAYFRFAEGLIDSDEDVSSTHSLDPMNYSNPDGQQSWQSYPRSRVPAFFWKFIRASCVWSRLSRWRSPYLHASKSDFEYR